jgi:hypothetical protein
MLAFMVKDHKKLFNTRMDSKTVRAIDFREGETIDDAPLKALVLEAVGLNKKEPERWAPRLVSA